VKYKKLVLVILAAVIFFLYTIHPVIRERLSEGYGDKLIRFHIRANSDSQEDQDLKLRVRDEILEEMGDKFSGIDSLREGRRLIEENLGEMKRIAQQIIKRENKDYEVDISLGIDRFPTRKYGELVLPTGDYETLLISLGEGKGQNWWCVMFPPLCFIDITHSLAKDAEEELEALSQEEGTLKLKWKILELIDKFKN